MRKMYGSIVVFVMLVIGLALTNCSKNSTDPEENDNLNNQSDWELVGTWTGSHFEFVSQADTSLKVDLSSYGVAYFLVVNADSSYSSTTSILGQTMSEAGLISIVGDQITLTSTTNESRSGTYEMTDTGASILITDEVFDFDQDGTDDPAFLFIDLVKV